MTEQNHKCQICKINEESQTETIWVYNQRAGRDIRVAVCDKCLKHFSHAAHIAEGIVGKMYK